MLFKNNVSYPSIFETFFNDYYEDNFHQKRGNITWDDEKEEYSVYIEAPGLSRDEIKIEYTSKELIIKGEISDETIKKQIGNTKINYIYSNPDIDSDTIKAELENGILYLNFKKLKNKESKFIKIS